MPAIVKATAFANDQVGYLSWRLDAETVPGCLGFHIVRELVAPDGTVKAEAALHSYVAFEGQANPNWLPQNTSVWPVQKLTWRDLGLRKFCEDNSEHATGQQVRYRIRAVGDLKPGLEPVAVVQEKSWNAGTKTWTANTYSGTPRPLGYLTEPAWTNAFQVTSHHAPFRVAFTNGILSTQFLAHVRDEAAASGGVDIATRLQTAGDKLREYMSGNVLTFMRDLFESNPEGRFRLALYELEDAELVPLLRKHAPRIDLILANAGGALPDNPKVNDERNHPARAMLQDFANSPENKAAPPERQFRLINRILDGGTHIGHNKFAVHLPEPGKAARVLTGSTNWTWGGLTAQNNNCIIIEDPTIAQGFADYWQRLCDDTLRSGDPTAGLTVLPSQGKALKIGNQVPVRTKLSSGASISTWFSPNVITATDPGSDPAKPNAPLDLAELFGLISQARKAIFFLVFDPSVGGQHSIISQSVEVGLANPALTVVGAIASAQAMWDESKAQPTSVGGKDKEVKPFIFQKDGVSLVRASALADEAIIRSLGGNELKENLTIKRSTAIIHDKVIVIDPMDPQKCVVAFGSHNLGYKASTSNDENLTIVTGHQALALAYTAHVLDVYDHYRFRAKLNEKAPPKVGKKKGTATQSAPTTPATDDFNGFLSVSDDWQATAGRQLSAYFSG